VKVTDVPTVIAPVGKTDRPTAGLSFVTVWPTAIALAVL
jgi:hypothetical protein